MIPYTVERRADTGVSNGALGMWLFLASEAMLFGALFSAYALLRTGAAAWADEDAVPSTLMGASHTLLLLTATACVWRARTTVRPAGWLMMSAAIGVAFLALKGAEYGGEFSRGLRPADGTFLAIYFTLTGLHALHVAGGVLGNLWAAAGASALSDQQTAGRTQALSVYWAFVDGVWAILFVLFYLP